MNVNVFRDHYNKRYKNKITKTKVGERITIRVYDLYHNITDKNAQVCFKYERGVAV